MNADDRGMNLAEPRRPAPDHLTSCPPECSPRGHGGSCKHAPAHGGYPGVPVNVSTVAHPALPSVDWECVAGRAFQENHRLRAELRSKVEEVAHLRRELDRRQYGGD